MKSLPLIQTFDTVVLAHGDFPIHPAAISILNKAKTIVCCDGAIDSLLQFGLEPTYVVGDLDSISQEQKECFADRLHLFSEQESNDLTKSVNFCKSNNYTNITILGATGKREDHTLGNIALLASYADEVNVQMVTDYGVMNAVAQDTTFESFAGQQVSIFRVSEKVSVTLENLKYPLHNSPLSELWTGTLNEATEKSFTVKVSAGKVVVFREHS